MRYLFGASTDVGMSKKTNQDSMAARVARTPYGEIAFGVLCDGMGGLSSGELASSSVICAFTMWFENELKTIIGKSFTADKVKKDWERIISEQNSNLYRYGKNHNIQTGTTLVAFLLFKNEYFAVNIGDSRMYILNDDIIQITSDQSLVAREVAIGRLTEADAEKDPRRNVLLQCIGVTEEVKPDYYEGRINDNEEILLCCDGFRHEISKEEIYDFLNPNNQRDISVLNDNLLNAIRTIKQRGEKDNISALVLKAFQ